jgi:hypothetical protein
LAMRSMLCVKTMPVKPYLQSLIMRSASSSDFYTLTHQSNRRPRYSVLHKYTSTYHWCNSNNRPERLLGHDAHVMCAIGNHSGIKEATFASSIMYRRSSTKNSRAFGTCLIDLLLQKVRVVTGSTAQGTTHVNHTSIASRSKAAGKAYGCAMGPNDVVESNGSPSLYCLTRATAPSTNLSYKVWCT